MRHGAGGNTEMTVLSNAQILGKLGNEVVIYPFDPRNVNTSSYDVCLGEWYFAETPPDPEDVRQVKIYNIYDRDAVKRVWGQLRRAVPVRALQYLDQDFNFVGMNKDDKVILLPPKQTILAHTDEFIGGRSRATTMMKARSSFGRNFIEVCKCAGYGDVGYFNRWTMEITNNSQYYHIPLVVGRRIAQIVFLETGPLVDEKEDYSYSGNYQDTTDLEDLKANWNPLLMLPRLDKDRDIQTDQPSNLYTSDHQ